MKLNKLKLNISPKRYLLIIILFLIVIGTYNTAKPLRENISYESKIYKIAQEDINILIDETYLDKNNQRQINQEIFDEIFKIISNADEYILIDMFLFNSYFNEGFEAYRNLSDELTNILIEKKKKNPQIQIDFITDEINTIYGTRIPNNLKLLENNGINIIYTNLNPLRDSNPIYSSIWRVFIQWFGVGDKGFFPHPFSNMEDKISLRSYLKLLNFKANHRKLILADEFGKTSVSIISSANPHDGSSAHSNIGIKFSGKIIEEIKISEDAIAKISRTSLKDVKFNYEEKFEGDMDLQLLTENKIKQKILTEIKNTKKEDEIKLAMFYFSDRDIINELLKASKRGVEIQIILDPNKDAFGYEKNGIPNRQVAKELLMKSNGKIKLRWYNTNGEQFHSKFLLINKKDGTSIIILGSANYTKRNLDNFNLESNIYVMGENNFDIFLKLNLYFDKIFTNNDGNKYTLDYSYYEDKSFWKIILYRFQELTGISTF